MNGTVAESTSAPWGLTPMTEHEFVLFRDLIRHEAGIALGPAKKPLLVARLSRRLRELGVRSFREYFQRVERSESEKIVLLDSICTNETHFFREPRQFDFVEDVALPRWEALAAAGRAPRSLRVWSAACSTGEEPYSLAMTLLRRLPGWDIEILSTDLSTRALARASAGVWRIDKARAIDQRNRKAFMLRGTGSWDGWMKAGSALRSVVRFERLNLVGDEWPARGPFQLVFCRNVLIYFEPATKVRVVNRLLDRLHPEGYLFLGDAESLVGVCPRARPVGPTVYALAATA